MPKKNSTDSTDAAPETAPAVPEAAAPAPAPDGVTRLLSEIATLRQQNAALLSENATVADQVRNRDSVMADMRFALQQGGAENESLRQQIADLQATKDLQAADEKLIAEKTAKGLSRAQAIAVIKRNRDFAVARAEDLKKRAAQKPKGA